MVGSLLGEAMAVAGGRAEGGRRRRRRRRHWHNGGGGSGVCVYVGLRLAWLEWALLHWRSRLAPPCLLARFGLLT